MGYETFLITGATGFLGSKIANYLIEAGKTVYCTRRQSSNLHRIKEPSAINWVLTDDLRFEQLFSQHRIDIIIHCATDYGRKKVDPAGTIEANLTLPINLLHYGAQNGVSAFINTDTVLDKQIGHYSLSKSQFCDWLRMYSHQLVSINVALHHFYGPGDDETKFATSIIRSLLFNSERIPLTLGEQKRDFIFIDDVLDAFKLIIKNIPQMSVSFHHFEVGSGETISVRKFAELAKELTHNTTTILDFGALPYRPFEKMDLITDISKLHLLGWKPSFTVSDGLIKTISLEILKL
jgi:CDP-paratose synthetase